MNEYKEQPLTVRTIRTFTEDLQQVGITYTSDYDMKKFVYYGTSENIPSHLIDKRVSKIYSDYHLYHGNFLVMVITD